MRYLPISELWFNIILRVLITIYWITWIWNLIAHSPDPKIDDDDELFKFNKTSYIFRLISSLLFFFFGISEFKNEILIYLTVIEIIIVLIWYTYLITTKWNYTIKQMKKIKQKVKDRKERIRKWY